MGIAYVTDIERKVAEEFKSLFLLEKVQEEISRLLYFEDTLDSVVVGHKI